MDVTPDALIALMGIVLSFLFAYFPGLKEWFDKMDPRMKPLFMALMLLLVTAGKLIYDCGAAWACIQINIGAALVTWLTALVLNQTAYATGVKQFKIAAWTAKNAQERPFNPPHYEG